MLTRGQFIKGSAVLGAAMAAGLRPAAAAEWVYGTAQAQVVNIPVSVAIALIRPTGEVFIDWDGIDKLLSDPTKADPTLLAYARVMSAIRDGTWKPMSEAQ